MLKHISNLSSSKMMDSRKWIFTGPIITMVLLALSGSQVSGDGDTIEKNVWLGDDVELHCGDNFTDETARSWRKENQIFLFGATVMVNNDRVSSVDSSTILRIENVTLDDDSYYTCSALTFPASTRSRTVHLLVKEKLCEAPLKPVNGDYESDSDTYRTGDTIRYNCDRGYQLIGLSNRTCTGTIKGWQPQEPYCQPEYISDLMVRLDGIQHKVSGIERRITTLEYNISNMGEKMSTIDNQCAINKNSKLTSVEANISLVEPLYPDADRNRSRLIVCTNDTDVTDADTVSKCLTMQLGERNGQSVSEFTLTLEDYDIIKRMNASYVVRNSEPFYHTVPGYKMRLQATIWFNYDLWINLMFVPSDSDEQLRWPFSTPYDMTVLLKNGTEFLYQSFSGQHPECTFNRPSVEKDFNCYDFHSGWFNVWKNKPHMLKDGSVTIKIYLYN